MNVATGLRSCGSASLKHTLAFKEARSCSVVAKAAKTSVIREIQQALKNKERSAVEITQSYLNAIASREERVGSFITVSEQQALEQVRVVCMGLYLSIAQASSTWSVNTHSVACLACLQAKALDAHIAKEGTAKLSPLAGVPLAIKVRPREWWPPLSWGSCGPSHDTSALVANALNAGQPVHKRSTHNRWLPGSEGLRACV